MLLNVITKIDKTVSETLGNKELLNNSFVGRSTASAVPQGQEMLIDQADSKEWIVPQASAAAFSKDLVSLLGLSDADEIKFIHIQCYKEVVLTGDIPAPIRFALEWDGNAMGKMSQFQLANADVLTAANITITDPEVAVGESCIIQCIFALKQ